MDEPQFQRPNREGLHNDPATLIGLSPLEKISEFWKRYDRQADIHDKKMTSNLSENLDVLLIFVSSLSSSACICGTFKARYTTQPGRFVLSD